MKTKDDIWYDEKVRSIKKRKRKLKHIEDSSIVKMIKKDLKREQRAAKRGSKQWWKKQIEEEIG
mgnify:CR=1 FL=1